MKHLCTGIVLAVLFLTSVPAWAGGIQSHFKPFTSLRVIQTEHFDIIFPPESEPSARLLASYADKTYEQVSSLLGIEVPFRIPVTFTPHTDLFNGYYTESPAPRIFLFDTPMDLEWTNFANNLEHLFLHELTHAVSMNTRTRFNRVIHRIFGNLFTPAWTSAPYFMLEGVTVSFESLSGFGRANDPLTKQKLRQALYEGKFLTPFQASGIYDIPGQEGMYYQYGGLFSAWLQQTYGMEKYAELWQAMGGNYSFSFFVYRSDFYKIFRKVYNIEFLEAWDAFSATLSTDDLEENPDGLLPKKYHLFSEKKNFISALSAGGNSLYFFNSSENKIHIYDTVTGKTRTINAGSAYGSYDIDVSADGTLLLISGYRYISNRAVATVTEHKAKSGLRTGRNIQGLYKARYFRDGVIGIRSELHNNCIVYEDFKGNREILFRGNEELVFSGPQAVDNERIVFVAARNGVRELWLYNYMGRELFRIEDSDGNNEHWLYMRDLSVSEGKLFFSHNADDRMYKLARIDLETMQALYSNRDFSGGVFNPVTVNGTIYYTGSFFSRDALLRFPDPPNSLSGTQSDIKLVKLDNKTYEIIAESDTPDPHPQRARQPEGWLPLPDTADSSGAGTCDIDPSTPLNGAQTTVPPLPTPHSRPYFGLRYINPFQFWFPMPLIRLGESAGNDYGFSLDGIGFFSMMADPAERNMVLIMALADIRYRMASIMQFQWQNTFLGFPVQTFFSDTVTQSGNFIYRSTNVSLGVRFLWTGGRWVHVLSPGGGYTRFAGDDGGYSAYYWQETGSYFHITTEYTLSNLRQRPNEIFGTGLELYLGGVSITDVFKPRVAGGFRANMETMFPFRLTLFGIYDGMGMDLHGVSRIYGGGQMARDYTLTEYPHPAGLDLDWLAGGEISMGLFSLEIQKHISHFYFNRFFGTLSLRNVLYDSKGHLNTDGIAINDLRLIQSLRLKLAIHMSMLPYVKQPVSIEPYIWGAWKFSNTITGGGNPLGYGFGASDSLGLLDSLFFTAGVSVRF